MTITRGLAEIKLLDSRIKKQTAEAVFTDCKNARNKVTAMKHMEEKALVEKAKADYQSVNDLIERRQKIKSMIMASNSVTRVKIAGGEYTVAEAIDKKSAIEYKKALLQAMKVQRAQATKMATDHNAKLEPQIQALLTANLGAQGKTVSEGDYDMIAKPFKEANELTIIDPLNLAEKIASLEAEIEDFEKEVDFTLSESNSRTEIDV